MSTEIGTLADTGSRGVEMSLQRFWGGDKHGICVQLTAQMEKGEAGYVQLSTADIIALIPVFKKYVLDEEMLRQRTLADAAIKETKELEKTLVADCREIANMAIVQPIYDMATLLFYGKKQVQITEVKDE